MIHNLNVETRFMTLGGSKNSNFRGLGRLFGLFMASRDGLMGYGYEIRLHNVGPTGRQPER